MKTRKQKRRRLLCDTPMTFGRYVGRPLRCVPRDYLLWVLDDARADAGTKWLIRQFLKR